MTKLTKLILAMALLVFLNACASDDDASGGDLEGTWKAVEFDADINNDTQFNGGSSIAVIEAEASDLDYQVTFDGGDWTTAGGYKMTTSGSVSGIAIDAQTSTYTNVSGSGTYSDNETTLTINGSFFEFDFNGAPAVSAGEAQTVDYEINSNDELIITQNETMTSTSGGVTSTATIVSQSKWERQ
ncbi:MAG: hypothetical protein AB8F74_12365 [Saprospiraceae bacterium]